MGLLDRLNSDITSPPTAEMPQPQQQPLQMQQPVAPQMPTSFTPAVQEKEEQKSELQTLVHKKLSEYMAKNGSSSKDEHFLYTTMEQIFFTMGKKDSPYKEEIITNIIHSIKGYGPIDDLLEDEEVTEIICCGYDNIWTERKGKMHQEFGLAFNSEEEFRNIVDSKILQPIGRRVDDNQPVVNARLSDGSRVNVVISPISAGGMTLDIRKFKKEVFTVSDYLKYHSLTEKMANFVELCIKARKNMIISGGTGSGKTTLMNCFSTYIPPEEAIITIEDTLELQLKQPCLRRLEARSANAEGTGAITIHDLLVNTLRMRPDRIIIGECRSHEVVEMLQAANTGHDGTMTSVHANTPWDALNNRLYNMYLMSGIGDVPEKAIKAQIASAIHVVIQIGRMADGSRKVKSICEVVGYGKDGMENNNAYVDKMGLDESFKTKNTTNVITQEIFRYDESSDTYITTGWIPTFWDTITTRNLSYTTIDGRTVYPSDASDFFRKGAE